MYQDAYCRSAELSKPSQEKKKIAAVHFNAIPCERYTADKVQGKKKSYVAIFVFVLTALCKLGLKTSGILYECC